MRRLIPNDAELLEQLEIAIFPNDCLNAYLARGELEAGGGLVIETRLGKGYILYRDTTIRDILRLGVEENARGFGLGEQLLLAALVGVNDAMLTVKKANTPALHLYMKHGFKIIGEDDRFRSWMMRRYIGLDVNLALHAGQ